MLEFELVWFDSFGAKSSCTLVKTDDVSILIDPGVAIMHRSFPASFTQKLRWTELGRKEIKKAAKEAEVIVISHYHWDHFSPDDMKLYEGKLILAKNPNEYINDSQRKRAVSFYTRLWSYFNETELEFEDPINKEYDDPAIHLKSVREGLYCNGRKREPVQKGRSWFTNRANKWRNYRRIPEVKFEDLEIRFVEGKKFRFGRTEIRFTAPLFHGMEYSRVGWVFMSTIQRGKEKLMHSSDVDGPIIEEYANAIIRENPEYLILDGPMTYMLGYMLNKTNLNRAIENAVRILKKTNLEVMIWDHHLPREPGFREHTKKVFEFADEMKKSVMTAREFRFGKKSLVEELAHKDNI